MWVHWKKRWMRFTHNKRRVRLAGVQDEQRACRPMSVAKLHGLLRRGAVADCIQVRPIHQEQGLNALTAADVKAISVEIQGLLAEFDQLFAGPVNLPPSRDCDHRVPLVPGAQPTNVRPSLPLRTTSEDRDRASDTGNADTWNYSTKLKPFCISSSSGAQEGRNVEVLRRLSSTQRSHNQK